MSTYIISKRKDSANFMAWKESEIPINKFVELGARHMHAEDFLSDHVRDVNEEDTVIIYYSLHEQEHKRIFRELKCVKVLRTLDAKSTDGIVHRKSLEFHQEIGGFDFWLIGIPNKEYNSVLSDRGIRGINFTHCTNFNDIDSPENVFKGKSRDIIVSGQLHEKYYPVRWNILQALQQQDEFLGNYLPHPGYEMDALRHPYVGDAYIDLCKIFWSGPVGTGHADGLHMKFLEFAKSYTIPLGNTPSYMDPTAASEVVKVGLGEPISETYRILRNLFDDKEALKDRIVRYSKAIRKTYDVNVIVPEVYEKILHRNFDF